MLFILPMKLFLMSWFPMKKLPPSTIILLSSNDNQNYAKLYRWNEWWCSEDKVKDKQKIVVADEKYVVYPFVNRILWRKQWNCIVCICHQCCYCKQTTRTTFVLCIYISISLVRKPWQTGAHYPVSNGRSPKENCHLWNKFYASF